MNLQDMIQRRNDLEERVSNTHYTQLIEIRNLEDQIFDLNHKIRFHPDYKTTREYEQDQNAENNGHIW